MPFGGGTLAKKTVLLVEDDAGDRNMYGNILWYNGYDVVFAEDGEAGLQTAAAERPDLIILDLQLPLLHGSELASRLKQQDETKQIPIVALTGRRLSEFGGNAAVLGYSRFLEKPVSPLEVLREVEHLIGRSDADQALDTSKPQVVRTQEEEPVVAVVGPPAEIIAPEIHRIAEHLLANTDAILARWEDAVREEPWFSLPREHRVANLAAVVQAIAEASLLAPGSRDAIRKVVIAGAKHGFNRREQGIPESVIPIEFHLLRRALWRYLSETFSPREDTYSAIVAVDGQITHALNASMWGYYREEIDAHGGWENAIEKLIDGAGTATPEPAEG